MKVTIFNNYYDRKVREICHAVKERDTVAIKEVADYFLDLELIKRSSILIPAPQHEGFAIYTREIADIVANETGCRIADVLVSTPRKTLYEQKIAGSYDGLHFRIKENVDGKELFFLDNVIDTGATFREANALLQGRLKPLVYAQVKH